MFFEHSGKMLRIFKSQSLSSLGDSGTADEQLLGTLQNKAAGCV